MSNVLSLNCPSVNTYLLQIFPAHPELSLTTAPQSKPPQDRLLLQIPSPLQTVPDIELGVA